MPRGVSLYDEARLQGRLWTPQMLAQRLRAKLWFWYSADFLTVDASGLVAGALDLTGAGRNGSQGTASARLTYFPSDRMFGGRPSFGSTSHLGGTFLSSPSAVLVFQYFVSCYYKDGIDNSFDFSQYIISGAGSFGAFRLQTNQATPSWQNLITGRTFYNTGDPFPRKNGFDPSQTLLPLPASVIESRAALGRSNITRIGGDPGGGQAWVGGFRHCLACNQILSAQETALVEGVISWDDGTQGNLNPAHPFAARPPLIGD